MKAGLVFTKDNEYYTPSVFVARFGKFDYDPATTRERAAEFGVEHFDTIETDGLKADWTPYKRIWINPPFTIKHEFFKKAVETFAKTKADIYILFPIEFLTTKRFHDILGTRGGVLYVPTWQESELAGLRELRYETRRHLYDYRGKDGIMIHAISIHAIERLQERRQLQHFVPHIHKMQGWGMPSNGTFEHNGFRYIMREGVLITVLPPDRAARRQNRADELAHYLIKYRHILFAELLRNPPVSERIRKPSSKRRGDVELSPLLQSGFDSCQGDQIN